MSPELWVAIAGVLVALAGVAVGVAGWIVVGGRMLERISGLEDRQAERIQRVRELRQEDREVSGRLENRVRDLEAKVERLMGTVACGD